MARALPDHIDLILGLDESEDPSSLREKVASKLGCALEDVPETYPERRSIDARKGRVKILLRVVFEAPHDRAELGLPDPIEVKPPSRVIIVGDGPAGLFCAYELARRGIACTVVDRGKEVQPRRRDLALLNRGERIDEDSNYCFGEGGAGTYSDGKLYTRAGKRGDIRDVIEVLARHGAPSAILTDARPHIGSNKLPRVITAMREQLRGLGVEIRFESRVEALLTEPGTSGKRIAGVRFANGQELEARAVVLATGHSARDVYTMLDSMGVRLIPKPFALGVRIEHPQPMINALQYGREAGHPKLPAASYRVAEQVGDRGVFSFCMCPGGWIVPAMTETDGLVVNGMSLSKRDSPFANSGLVVAIEPPDWERAGHTGPLGGVELQRVIERAAMQAGGGEHRAPATRGSDFLAGRGSSSVPAGSYLPGFTAADVAEALNAGGIDLASKLRTALGVFERRMPGYGSSEAVLVGVESRTSSPVRIPRDPETLESPDVSGLYPTGEGGGYAGGIVSAALDGINVARRVAARVDIRH